MPRLTRDNGLSLVLLGLFLFSLFGQYVTGWMEFNEDRRSHGNQAVTAVAYLAEGHFWEALFENWESEFLQMSAFVLLTAILIQKGSAESRKDSDITSADVITSSEYWNEKTPWPVKKGGIVLTIYENSLSIALLLLFLGSFIGHGIGGARNYNEEQAVHGGEQLTTLGYMETSRFWFESFQNWQSEFLSIAAMVILTIFLRQKGSPESKPVDAPHSETGC